jgi:hypothetical protein
MDIPNTKNGNHQNIETALRYSGSVYDISADAEHLKSNWHYLCKEFSPKHNK